MSLILGQTGPPAWLRRWTEQLTGISAPVSIRGELLSAKTWGPGAVSLTPLLCFYLISSGQALQVSSVIPVR